MRNSTRLGSEMAIGSGIGLISLALMLTQIVLTRIFSVIVWYHFAFFAISVALLGLGASAIVVHLAVERLQRAHAQVHLAIGSQLFGLSVVGLPLFLLNVSPDWFGVGGTTTSFFTAFTPKLLGVFIATTLPFFAGGFVISLAFARWPEAIHRNYAWDLVGAALACALVIPLLDRFGGPKALIGAAGIAGLAGLSFAFAVPVPARKKSVVGHGLAALCTVALGLGFASSGAFELRIAKGLDLARTTPEFNRWNSFSLISVMPSWNFRGWGLSPAYTGEVPEQKSLVIDMNAFTSLTAFDGDLSRVQHTRYDLSALVFRVYPAPRQACIVGAGGGKDVLAALAAGSHRVTAVEVNPLIVNDVMRGRYRSFTGGLYDRSDVSVQIEDARSFLHGSDARYDTILISMVDTSAATAAGAYSLAENSLYTVSAFRDFLARLAPNGILTVASVSLEGLAVGARLASLARVALREIGSDPATSVAVVRTPWLSVPNATMYNFLIKPAGFTAADLASLSTSTEELRFDVARIPGRTTKVSGEAEWIHKILTTRNDQELAAILARWPLDVSPVDDDRPFFFYQNRLRDAPRALLSAGETHLFGNGLAVLLKVFLASIVMIVICIGLPLYLTRRSEPALRRGSATELWYVGCIGVGYMFIEIACIQQMLPFLGTPTHALTAVLLVLLLSGGIGSRAAAGASPRMIQALLGCLLGYAVLFSVLWPVVASASASVSGGGRALIASAFLTPLGFLMGIPLPSALSAVQRRGSTRVPWLWGVNGAASVFGSVAATLGSMHAGITAVFASGIVLYLGAALLWRKVGRTAP